MVTIACILPGRVKDLSVPPRMLSNDPFHFLPKKYLAMLLCSSEYFCQQIPMRSIIHSAKRCCYRKSIYEGVLRIRIFLLCTPLYTPLQRTTSFSDRYIRIFVILSPKQRHTLCVGSQDILILKGTKHQLSVYDKIPMCMVSLMPMLHFS